VQKLLSALLPGTHTCGARGMSAKGQ